MATSPGPTTIGTAGLSFVLLIQPAHGAKSNRASLRGNTRMTNRDKKKMGRRIRQARRDLEEGQAQHARRSGVKDYTLCSLEKGRQGISVDTLMALSQSLGVTTDWILLGE